MIDGTQLHCLTRQNPGRLNFAGAIAPLRSNLDTGTKRTGSIAEQTSSGCRLRSSFACPQLAKFGYAVYSAGHGRAAGWCI